MPRSIAAIAVLLLLVAPSTWAAGINVYWNSCGPGATLRSFACNSNFGVNDVVASFVPPPGLTAVTGAVGTIDLIMGTPTLAPWWRLDAGGCRENAFSVTAEEFTGQSSCASYWQGLATASASYQVIGSGWDRARLVVTVSLDPQYAGPLDPATEYHAFTVRIRNTSTVGDYSCGGCSEPACIVLGEIQLQQPDGTPGGSPAIMNPESNNYLHWQGFVFNCPYAVPVANRTWGQVKSLYR